MCLLVFPCPYTYTSRSHCFLGALASSFVAPMSVSLSSVPPAAALQSPAVPFLMPASKAPCGSWLAVGWNTTWLLDSYGMQCIEKLILGQTFVLCLLGVLVRSVSRAADVNPDPGHPALLIC